MIISSTSSSALGHSNLFSIMPLDIRGDDRLAYRYRSWGVAATERARLALSFDPLERLFQLVVAPKKLIADDNRRNAEYAARDRLLDMFQEGFLVSF